MTSSPITISSGELACLGNGGRITAAPDRPPTRTAPQSKSNEQDRNTVTDHPRIRRWTAVAAIASATLAASATATAEPLRLEPFSGPGQAEHVNHNGTSGSGNGSVDTTGSYEGDAFLGSAALAYAIDHPLDLGLFLLTYTLCGAQSASGDRDACLRAFPPSRL